MPSKSPHTFFYFTRKDRRGSLFLLIVVLFLCFIPFFYPLLFNKKVTEDVQLDTALLALKTKQAAASQNRNEPKKGDGYSPYDYPASSSYTARVKGTLFNFDPNLLPAEGWKKLGLRDKTINTILNFRAKGGRFRQPEDIKKIWGLFPDEAERLIPFVQIAANVSNNELYKNNSAENKPKSNVSIKAMIPVEINSADTAAFIALPGIGSKLSQRIINFRDKLGGFYMVDQVKETFGLSDSVFQKIKPQLLLTGEVKKININTARLDELKVHPYIKYPLANAIVQYRTQHGAFKSVEDLKKLMIVSDEILNKVRPYLSID
ncbi:MAG: helix-hairpin-helix domain-containing protein [Ferruginibacter sp.]